jgi:hypothetical protein
MKSGNLQKLVIILIAFPFYFLSTSYSGGISGVSQAGCNCHGPSSANTIVSISPSTGTFYSPGERINFTVTVANPNMTTGTSGGGFNLSTNIGTLENANGETQLIGDELTHTSRKASNTGSVSWDFVWTAPASGSGLLQLFVAGNAVDGTGGTGNDQWNFGTASIALPVDFVSFNTKVIEEKIQLNWEIGSKVNASHFDVLRSADGFDFVKIASLEITDQSIYSFEDSNPILGVNYYKLKEVDFDNQIQYSDVVTQLMDGKNIQIYPSLIENGSLHIDYFREQSLSIHILSVTGKEIYKNILTADQNKIDLSKYPSGIYIAAIKSNDNTVVKTQKIVLAN